MFNRKEYQKKYRIKNKAKLNKYAKEYYIKNKPKITQKHKEYNKKYRIKNKDKINKYKKEYYVKNKAKLRKQEKENYIKNKPKIKENKKEYYIKNKAKIKEYNKEYHKNNPEIRKNITRKRKAIMNNIIEDFSNKEWLQKLKNTFGVCPKCNKYVGMAHLELDHIYPVSIADKDFKRTDIKRIYTIEDVQPLCHSCNSKKGNR